MNIAFVTGANRGLGLGFVKKLLGRGFIVYAACRNTNSINLSHKNLIKVQIDVADNNSIQKAVDQISNNGHKLSLVINNAGVNKDSVADGNKAVVCNLIALDRSALTKMLIVNAVSPLMIVKYLKPLMQEDSLIINISSNRASFHDPNQNSSPNFGYRASKAALNMYTQALADDTSVPRVVAVHPGAVQTDINPTATTTPEQASQQIINSFLDNWDRAMHGGFFNKDGSIFPF